jgi:DNA-binding NarL/FixJ family response regulator
MDVEVIVDTKSLAQRGANEQELLAAAAAAMRLLLQDRQAHAPAEMLDPRERKVLRQLRDAARASLDECD